MILDLLKFMEGFMREAEEESSNSLDSMDSGRVGGWGRGETVSDL